jgi:hypothetical protein
MKGLFLKGLVLLIIVAHPSPLSAEEYMGGGYGLGEACSTLYQPSFSGGERNDPELLLRGFIGNRFNNYFAVEGVLEGMTSPWKFFGLDYKEAMRISAFTLGGNVFFSLPLSHRSRLFAGPSVGGSLVYVSWDTEEEYNSETQQQETTTNSDAEFSWNYGWSAGIEFVKFDDSVVRLQWQNWRSLDSEVAFGGEVNTNYLSINFFSRF